jgi:glycosyltransferase involved in cell wall biosynthesis
MRVLLLSAYDAESHRYWHTLLRAGIPDWQWTLLTLPPRHFAWRVRSNALTWSAGDGAALAGDYDLLLATSMVDLATLRGLVPGLTRIPNIVYFHENQFVYPRGQGRHGLLEAQLCTLYSALAADRLVFNSAFNRDSFLDGSDELLAAMPDGVPRDVSALIGEKSSVLPVPLATETIQRTAVPSEPLQLIWNHRWEYDKGPDELLALCRTVIDSGLAVVVHVVGQQFRRQPDAFAELRLLLEAAGVLGSWGYLEDRRRYLERLASCDVVLSTALHDFQGLSVLEACALGCTPLVPDRLVYPEWVDAGFRYSDREDALEKLKNLARHKLRGQALPRQNVSRFAASTLLPRYRALLEACAA